eukprot:376413_1
MTNKESMNIFYEKCGFKWNDFTKHEVMKQILQLSKERRREAIEREVEYEDNIQTHFCLLVLNSYEQILYHKYLNNNNNIINLTDNECPSQKELKIFSEKLQLSINDTMLEKIFCIAESKFILQKLIQYLSFIIKKAPKYNI